MKSKAIENTGEASSSVKSEDHRLNQGFMIKNAYSFTKRQSTHRLGKLAKATRLRSNETLCQFVISHHHILGGDTQHRVKFETINIYIVYLNFKNVKKF